MFSRSRNKAKLVMDKPYGFRPPTDYMAVIVYQMAGKATLRGRQTRCSTFGEGTGQQQTHSAIAIEQGRRNDIGASVPIEPY